MRQILQLYAAALVAYNSPKELIEIMKRDYDEENLKEYGLL